MLYYLHMQEHPLFLAPLAGYTDKTFRQIAHSFGADGSVTEMVSAEGLARDSAKTKALLDRYPGEENLIVQIFAPSEDPVARCLDTLLAFNPSMIDINCGCPVPKVVKTGAGSALMKDPAAAARMVRTIKERTDIPVSVKFRLGWDSSSINYIAFADAVYEAGASVLTLHARTRAQGYAGQADREAFRQLASHMEGSGAFLFASGDIFTPEDAGAVIDGCGMDGVMFARGAIGNPFIFRMAKEYMASGSYALPSAEEKVMTALSHLRLAIDAYGEAVACREMRKQLMAYIKGIEGASRAKASLTQACTEEECRSALLALIGK